MNRILTVICCILLVVLFLGCISRWEPPEGNWFCEDLQIQISFSGGDCFYIWNNTMIPCDCINNRGSHSFFVLSQAHNIDELPVGTELFSAIHMEFTDTYMIATEEHTKEEYVFVKIE